jgi:hypothetical protein
MLDGSGVKAMPGSIPTPNSGSLSKNKKIQVAKWGTPKKTSSKLKKKIEFTSLDSFQNEKKLII